MTYDLRAFRLPRLGNRALQSVVAVLENSMSRRLLEPGVIRELGVHHLREAELIEPPTFLPLHPAGSAPSQAAARASLTAVRQAWNDSPPKPAKPGVHDYARAYRNGRRTPEEVVEKLIAALEADASAPRPINALIAWMDQDIRQQARASTERFAAGKPLSVLDGVPVAVKDELDALPYATTGGTCIFGQDSSAEADSSVVARLREAGAIIIGKTNMHEIGIGVTGSNVHYGHCRNPANPAHYAGGSSSGSAAAVAAGYCPLAVGADGGGSIRIPSALCGVLGLKPTYGRVSGYGALPLCWSVEHVGPIASSIDDLAIGYSFMAGADLFDGHTVDQPPVHLLNYQNTDLSGLKIGIYRPWFKHAQAAIVKACQDALAVLEHAGAEIVDIEVEALELQRVAHAVLICSEMLCAVDREIENQPSDFADDARLALAIGRYFSNSDYIRAQRLRTRFLAQYENLLREVDVIAMPTTGIVAPPIRTRNDESSETSLTITTDLMRFAFPGNLTGLPCLSVPVGTDEQSLPIGLQLMGKAWHEHTLLQLGRIIERNTDMPLAKKRVNLLTDEPED